MFYSNTFTIFTIRPQTDLCKAKFQPFKAQLTTPVKAQRSTEVLGWEDSAIVSMLRTNEGRD